MKRLTAVVLLGATISTRIAFADDNDDARDAAAVMAAVTVCNTSISEDLKRVLYAKMLKVMRTPSQINYTIGQEVQALNELSTSDRTAMCLALGDRAKSLTP
jgi:parvulin-like peptidyl-prolyl isomerase